MGTCPDMCPEKERYMREDRRRLSWYELDRETSEPGVSVLLCLCVCVLTKIFFMFPIIVFIACGGFHGDGVRHHVWTIKEQ